ncbi:hypothetical protein [Enterococcus sp. LJL90]
MIAHVDQGISLLNQNQNRLLIVGIIFAVVMLVLAIFFLLFKMGDDERSDYLGQKIATVSLMVLMPLLTFLFILNPINWQVFLLTCLLMTGLVAFSYTVFQYRRLIS